MCRAEIATASRNGNWNDEIGAMDEMGATSQRCSCLRSSERQGRSRRIACCWTLFGAQVLDPLQSLISQHYLYELTIHHILSILINKSIMNNQYNASGPLVNYSRRRTMDAHPQIPTQASSSRNLLPLSLSTAQQYTRQHAQTHHAYIQSLQPSAAMLHASPAQQYHAIGPNTAMLQAPPAQQYYNMGASTPFFNVAPDMRMIEMPLPEPYSFYNTFHAAQPLQRPTMRPSSRPEINNARRPSSGARSQQRISAVPDHTMKATSKPARPASANALRPASKLPLPNRAQTAIPPEFLSGNRPGIGNHRPASMNVLRPPKELPPPDRARRAIPPELMSGEHGIGSQERDRPIYWECPKCGSGWRKSPERLMNIRRSGRYFLSCGNKHCLASLVVTRDSCDGAGEFVFDWLKARLLTDLADTVDELRDPTLGDALPVYGKNEMNTKKGLKQGLRKAGRAVKGIFTGARGDDLISESGSVTSYRTSSAASVATQGTMKSNMLKRLAQTHADGPRNPQLPAHGDPQPKSRRGSDQSVTFKPHPTVSSHALDSKSSLPLFPRTTFMCPECLWTYPDDDRGKDELQEHMAQKHSNQKGLQSAHENFKKSVQGPLDQRADEPGEDDGKKDDGPLFPACELCGETFSTEAQRAEHVKFEHVKGRCKVCGEWFGSRKQREGHEKEMHSATLALQEGRVREVNEEEDLQVVEEQTQPAKPEQKSPAAEEHERPVTGEQKSPAAEEKQLIAKEKKQLPLRRRSN